MIDTTFSAELPSDNLSFAIPFMGIASGMADTASGDDLFSPIGMVWAELGIAAFFGPL